VRAAAAFTLGDVPVPAPDVRAALVAAVRDPVRLVRHQAAFALRGIALDDLASPDRAAVETAFDEWTAAQQYLGDLPEPNHNLGVFMTARGRPEEAMAAYRRALARWPDRHVSRQNLAMLLLDAGREAEAERELAVILEREPGWPPAAMALGLLQGRHQRWDDAARSLEACVAADPRYPRAQYNLGRVRLAQGDVDAAAMAFERAVDDPESRTDALRELVRVAYKRGDHAGLERWLGDALAADPNVGGAPELREFLAARNRPPSPSGGTP
jgi:tetratricopeptide (TPR) repeat protein